MPTHRVSPEHPDPQVIQHAAEHLRQGRLVAFPTETVYGLGAHAMDPAAVARIYEAKGRPAWNPLIVHLASAHHVHSVASEWPAVAGELADAFWPGPLTLVVPRQPDVPDAVTAGLPTVALRVPAHPVAHALLVAAGVPVAAPSANRSMALSPTRAVHVEQALGDRVAMILDGGPTTVGIESTVVDLTGPRPRLLRPGGLPLAELERVAGRIELVRPDLAGDAPRPSPGMMERHYAPRARLVLFTPADAAHTGRLVIAERDQGGRPAAVLLSERNSPVMSAAVTTAILPPDPRGYARVLYETLHRLDAEGCTLVAVEEPPDEPGWEGVRDRLRRASTA